MRIIKTFLPFCLLSLSVEIGHAQEEESLYPFKDANGKPSHQLPSSVTTDGCSPTQGTSSNVSFTSITSADTILQRSQLRTQRLGGVDLSTTVEGNESEIPVDTQKPGEGSDLLLAPTEDDLFPMDD